MNLAVSCSVEVRLKYWVTLSSPPVRMPLASCTLIFDRIAENRLGLGHGILGGMVHRFDQLIGLFAHAEHAQAGLGFLQVYPGSGILTLLLPRKPPFLPSEATA